MEIEQQMNKLYQSIIAKLQTGFQMVLDSTNAELKIGLTNIMNEIKKLDEAKKEVKQV